MGSENEDRCLPAQSKLDETNRQFQKESKISYTRDFLLSFTELDVCKKLPTGFDPSILSEFDDVSNSISERQRMPGILYAHGFRGSEYGSSPPTRGDLGNCSRGICGRWDSHSSGLNDRDSFSQSDRVSDSGRRYGNQTPHSWQNPEHDGLLGNGAFPNVSGCTAGASAPKVQGNGHHQLNRNDEPYRPPRPYKAVPHSGRASHDSCNDETFGSAECLSQERAEEERRRRASFELMRKERQKGIQEKQKQITNEHKENFDPHIAALPEDSRIDKGFENRSNELEECVVIPAASNNNSAKISFPRQTPASRPLVPPGFTSRILEINPGTKSLTHPPAPEVGNVEFEDILTCGKSNPVATTACDSQEEKQSKKHIGSSDRQHETKSINVPFISENEKIVIPSSAVEVSNNLVGVVNPSYGTCVVEEDEVIDFDAEKVTADKTMGLTGQDHSTLILEKTFGSDSTVKSGDLSSFIVHHDVNADDTQSPILHFSKFADWFLEEEKKPAGGISSGIGKGGSHEYGVPNGKVTKHDPSNFSSERNELTHELMTFTSTSATDGISDQLYSCNKPTVSPAVLTCEDLEQSILSEINENSSTQRQSVQDWSVYDTENVQPNSANDDGASQHLLSLLQKGASLKDLTTSSKVNVGYPDQLHLFEIESDSSVLNISSKGNTGNCEKNLTLKMIFGTGFTKELPSTEASLSVQRGSVGSVTRTDVSKPCGFSCPVADNNFSASTIDEYGSVGICHEGIMASNCAERTVLDMSGGNHSGYDDARAEIGSNILIEQGSKLSPVAGFDEKADSTVELCLPEEDSLITIDDPIVPHHSMFMSARKSIKADFLASTTPVDIAEKLAALNVALSDERSTVLGLEGPPFLSGSYDVKGSETPCNLHVQQSYPQFHQSQMNPGRTFSHQAHMSSQFNFMDPKTIHRNPSLHHHFRGLSRPFQNTPAQPTRFDNPVPHSLLQQMHMPGNSPPHLVNGLPRGAQLPRPINQMACYTQELNELQTFPLNYQQPSGLGMPNRGHAGDQVAFNRLIEMELRAKKIHPFAVAGRGQETYGKQVDRGFWYQQ